MAEREFENADLVNPHYAVISSFLNANDKLRWLSNYSQENYGLYEDLFKGLVPIFLLHSKDLEIFVDDKDLATEACFGSIKFCLITGFNILNSYEIESMCDEFINSFYDASILNNLTVFDNYDTLKLWFKGLMTVGKAIALLRNDNVKNTLASSPFGDFVDTLNLEDL